MPSQISLVIHRDRSRHLRFVLSMNPSKTFVRISQGALPPTVFLVSPGIPLTAGVVSSEVLATAASVVLSWILSPRDATHPEWRDARSQDPHSWWEQGRRVWCPEGKAERKVIIFSSFPSFQIPKRLSTSTKPQGLPGISWNSQPLILTFNASVCS